MNEKLKANIKESLSSVLPITIIVFLLSVTLVPVEAGTFLLFLGGSVLLIVGMGFFQLGAEMSMTPLGQGVGSKLSRFKSLAPVLLVCFVIGTLATLAEPDLTVLANQVAAIPTQVLIWTVALGVGVFLAVAVLRIRLQFSLRRLLLVCYILLFLISFFSPSSFVAVAFDSGGVTTGPITVPFIMALGIGLSAARSDASSAEDSFGLMALSSVGPVMLVLALGIFYRPSDASYDATVIPDVENTADAVRQFATVVPAYTKEVLTSILPVIGVLVAFQLITRYYRKRQLQRMAVGVVYTVVGLIMFLSGVNIGFAPVGALLGQGLGASQLRWALVPIGVVVGYYLVKAEPAVQVLNKQVEDTTGGTVSAGMMNVALSIGVACAVAISMVRVLTGLNIYWVLIPGYAVALLLSFWVPPVFVGIAFDSGGVASGTMTSTFLLPLAMGACTAVGGNVITDAFGVVALVALAPLIAIQIMGLVYARQKKAAAAAPLVLDDTFVEFELEQEAQ